MGCDTCSNNSGSGTPGGCKNNGTCSSGGCNKLAVFDWLSNMDLPNGQKPFDVVEVRFKNSRKEFYRNKAALPLNIGEVVTVESSAGYDVGIISATGELARLQMNKRNVNYDSKEIQTVHRKAEENDLEKWRVGKANEDKLMFRTREIAAGLELSMKVCDVEFQGDGSKATFFYTAEERVDFRQLIKVMAEEFAVRIEMRQIGARQEAARLGGIGSCGRELCCSTWLTDFRSVSTSSARYQQLSLNPQKLAGQCGKLKCCLNYELDMYLEAFKEFPGPNTRLDTKKGRAFCIKIDIFKRTLWFVYEDEAIKTPIPLGLDQVNKILDMNKEDKKPHDLKDFMEVFVDESPDYDNVDGQDSLSRFDHLRTSKKRKKKPRNSGGQNRGGGAKPNAPKGDASSKPAPSRGRRKGPNPRPRPEGGKPRTDQPNAGGPKKEDPSKGPQGSRPPSKNKRRKGGGNRPKPSGDRGESNK